MSNDHGAAYWCDQYHKIEQQLAEANKKLAEQQAAIMKATEAFDITGREYRSGFLKGGSVLASDMRVDAWKALAECGAGVSELVSVIAKAKEEGRAEAQARIKVLEDDMRMIKTSADSSEGICDNGYSAAYIAEQALAFISTTSPTEALDKVVREAKVEEAMMWADWFESAPVADAFKYRDMFLRHAESLRRIAP